MTDARQTLEVETEPGLTLRADAFGHPEDQPVLLLHGGGQTRHAWREAAERLARRGFSVVVPDLRGHGESDWARDGEYGVPRHGSDVRALATIFARPPVLVGASLGGLASLLASGEAPHLPIAALVLVDVAHRPIPSGVGRIVAFMRAHPDGFASVEEASAHVAAYLPHRTPPPDSRGLRNNLRLRDGRWRWHWDPRLLDADDLMPPERRLLAAARGAAAPTLLVRGAISDVVDDAIADELVALVPTAQRIDVAGAAHMVAGDRNDRFLDAILPALERAASETRELDGLRRWLRRHEVDAIPHPGGTLLSHLERTAGRLAAWGADRDTRLAGLAHAAYGTDGFDRALLTPTDSHRDSLRREIGERAEALVYLYAATDRAYAMPYREGDGARSLRDRFSGRVEHLSAETARALATLTAANELDVLLHRPDLAGELRVLLDGLLPTLTPLAARALGATLESHRSP